MEEKIEEEQQKEADAAENVETADSGTGDSAEQTGDSAEQTGDSAEQQSQDAAPQVPEPPVIKLSEELASLSIGDYYAKLIMKQVASKEEKEKV